MGFTKIGGRWVSKDGDQACPSETNEGDEPEEAAMQDEPAAKTQEGEHHDFNMDEKMPIMSSFERLMINKMDTFADNQRNLHEMWESRLNNMHTRFSTLDEQIEKVQRQILEL